MKKILILILSCAVYLSYGQVQTKKINKNINYYSEKYYVLKSDRNIKHGPFEKRREGKLICKGQFNMNNKSGVWEYYNFSGDIELKYDFDSLKLVFWEKYNSDVEEGSRPVLFIGSTVELLYSIAEEAKTPEEALQNNISEQVIVAVEIDSTGVAQNYYIKQGDYMFLLVEALRAVKEVTKDLQWIPAQKEGICVDSQYYLPIKFTVIK
jgi:hypothetical protein